jgi:hypothetical protein
LQFTSRKIKFGVSAFPAAEDIETRRFVMQAVVDSVFQKGQPDRMKGICVILIQNDHFFVGMVDAKDFSVF